MSLFNSKHISSLSILPFGGPAALPAVGIRVRGFASLIFISFAFSIAKVSGALFAVISGKVTLREWTVARRKEGEVSHSNLMAARLSFQRTKCTGEDPLALRPCFSTGMPFSIGCSEAGKPFLRN